MDGRSYVKAVLTRFVFRSSVRPARLEVRNVVDALLVWAFRAAVAGFMLTASCSTPVTILVVSAPSSVTAGSPLTVTVTAMADGNRDSVFNSDVHFSSSDSAASLPLNYTFTASDAGSHTFTNGIILMTPGNQSITVTDTFAASITGTAGVTVSAAVLAMQK